MTSTTRRDTVRQIKLLFNNVYRLHVVTSIGLVVEFGFYDSIRLDAKFCILIRGFTAC